MADSVNVIFCRFMPNVNFAMYSFSNLFLKMQKNPVSSRPKIEMEYAIIFIFREEKWFVAQSTALENVIKRETRELMHLQTKRQPIKCQKTPPVSFYRNWNYCGKQMWLPVLG